MLVDSGTRRANLPKVTGHVKGHLEVTQPERVVKLALVKVKTNELIPRESHPVDIENRAQYFVDAYKRGLTIPPILVHKLPNGKYEILDGHARVEAYRRLGVKEIPAIENSILEKLGAGAKKAGHFLASGARVASKVVTHTGKALEEGLSQAGRISRAYSGEVAPREELEHEESLAEIRARRQEPKPSTVINVGKEDEAEIIRRKQELESLQKEIAKQKAIIRTGHWSKVERRSLREKISSLQKQARKTAEGLPQKTKKE
jgi:hypothetical protein